MKRPLYIEGKPGCRVDREEPALKVKSPAKADLLFPLVRVSRVTSFGPVDWGMEALMACADRGVNLVFLHRTGEIRARWLGVRGERQVFLQRLADLMNRCDGPESYRVWHASMVKTAARSAARRIGVEDWWSISVTRLRRGLEHELTPEWMPVIGRLRGLLSSEAISRLAENGLDADNELFQSEPMDLPGDFAEFLLWDFYSPVLEWKNRGCQMPDLARTIGLYESRAGRVEKLLRGSINKLHRFLLETC